MERAAVLRFTGPVEHVDEETLPQRFLLDPTRREVKVGRDGNLSPEICLDLCPLSNHARNEVIVGGEGCVCVPCAR